MHASVLTNLTRGDREVILGGLVRSGFRCAASDAHHRVRNVGRLDMALHSLVNGPEAPGGQPRVFGTRPRGEWWRRCSARQGRTRQRWMEVFSPALLIARSCMRVYNRSVLRKCASFAFGLALIVALGLAMAHAQPLKAPGGSTGFSTPCEPASPSFKATSESKVVSTIDSTFAAENAGAPASVVRGSRVEAVSRSIPPPAPWAYPPLLHRPPPVNS